MLLDAIACVLAIYNREKKPKEIRYFRLKDKVYINLHIADSWKTKIYTQSELIDGYNVNAKNLKSSFAKKIEQDAKLL